MAKALFHTAQRVFVKPVGTWARVERIVPHWVKGVDEPLRIAYDCGLGRLFQSHELLCDQVGQDHALDPDEDDDLLLEHWRIVRRMIRWRADDPGTASTHAGTYPVVATDEAGAGGWRVPSTEYARDPKRVEHEARMIVSAPHLLRIARKLTDHAAAYPERLDEDTQALVRRCSAILSDVYRLEYAPAETAE